MTNTITNNGLTVLHQATLASRSSPATGGAAGETSTGATAGQDRVVLTDSVRALQTSASPDAPIDNARVQRLREAVANGTYKIDYHRIAERLVNLDIELHGKK